MEVINLRIRKVEDEKKLEKVIDEYITQGYKVKSRGEQTVKVKKSDYGGLGAHLLILIFFGWWLLLIPNLIYAVYRNSKGDEVLVKIED